jgi:hypothetical protein
MPELLRPEESCTHDGGTIVMTAGDVPRCGDCHTEMVWIAKSDYEKLRRSPTERERELQRLLNTRTSSLVRISQYLREVGIG